MAAAGPGFEKRRKRSTAAAAAFSHLPGPALKRIALDDVYVREHLNKNNNVGLSFESFFELCCSLRRNDGERRVFTMRNENISHFEFRRISF